MKISTTEYDEMVKEASPSTKSVKNVTIAFLIGGLICGFGEALRQIYILAGLSLSMAAACVSITYIGLTAIMTGLGIFDDFASVAGAGAFVPISGFANSMISSALEFKTEGFVLGLGVKMFIISGPVLIFGVSASVIYGVILYIIQCFGG